jgi:hypothetical protein
MTYVRCHRYDARPYIGEYLDEKTGEWIMGANPRSRFYHHSTFADLLIEGVIGLQAREDDTVEVSPLLPAQAWEWFALEKVRYRGHELAIVWDRDGKKFGRAGFTLYIDGRQAAHARELKALQAKLVSR